MLIRVNDKHGDPKGLVSDFRRSATPYFQLLCLSLHRLSCYRERARCVFAGSTRNWIGGKPDEHGLSRSPTGKPLPSKQGPTK